MSKRITIMLDEDLDKKLRGIQAKEIPAGESGLRYVVRIALLQ
jgi:hypothetical protein